jgi:hypothetical protein
MKRTEFLAPLIGEPWAWQSRNCWDFACHVQRELFGRELPHLSVPDGFSRRWVWKSLHTMRSVAAGARCPTDLAVSSWPLTARWC